LKDLAAKYSKANLKEVVDTMKLLQGDDPKYLLDVLRKYKELFGGTLGKWKGVSYHIE